MTERLRNALDAYRKHAQQGCSADFSEQTLDRVGLADRYAIVASPIGEVFVAWSRRGVSALRECEDAEAFERWYRRRFSRRAFPLHGAEPEIVEHVRRALDGEDVDFPVDLRDCTAFETAVLAKAREIPKGHARPYAWVAREIGHPRAVRAVGSALANNPVPLLIPCHRVVRSDYTTGEYVFGAERKRTLLREEGLHLDAIAELARQGVRYIGQPEDKCFCLPTCGTTLVPSDYPGFHSAEEALACGLHPCDVCRPTAA